MAASTRLVYNSNAIIGGVHLANAVRLIRDAQQEIAFAVGVANAITGGGITGSNLEGSIEFDAGVGQGAALYTAMNDIKTNLATVSSVQINNLIAN
jgi:hypothetical protein